MRLLVVVLLVPVAYMSLRAQQPTATGSDAKQAEAAAPVDIAPEPTDSAEHALRAIRNRLHNSQSPIPPAAAETQSSNPASAKRSRFDTRPSGPASVIYVDRGPFPPNTRPEDYQFPVGESDTIILGLVIKGQPYLSEDGTTLYTEYTISVEAVFKDNARLSLKRNSVVALDRMGGSLRLASGKVVQTDIHGLGDQPVTGHRYVCFLNYDARGYWFSIDKLWELRNGVAAPMDPIDQGLAQAGRSHFTGMGEDAFLDAVRDAVRRAGTQR